VAVAVRSSLDAGIACRRRRADKQRMIWPVAALAIFLLGFVVVYGSVLQGRIAAGVATRVHEDPVTDIDTA
jgi:uncharacterized membrane protein (DUF4010 family)